MARGVLGNDPFKRGAAQRPEAAERPDPAARPEQAGPRAAAKKAASKDGKKAAAARKPAPAPKKGRKPAPEKAPRALRQAARSLEGSAPGVPEPALSSAAPAPAVPETPAAEDARFESTVPYGIPLPRIEPEAPKAPPSAPPPAGEPLSAAVARGAASALVLGRDLVANAARNRLWANALGTASGLFRALSTGLGTAGGADLDDYGKDADLARELGPLSGFVYDRWWRVTVEGADQVPSGPCILVANHSGAMPLDGPVLHAALTRERPDLSEARWLVEDQVFHAPFLGVLLNRLGAVRACPQNAIRLLEEGRPVIVFPEGVQGISKPFRERYRLMRFGRGGFVKLALRQRVPVVPVAIVGAEEAMPLLARLPGKVFGIPYLPLTSPIPLPARWLIRFGAPLEVEDHPPEAADDLVLVHQLTERVRDAVQGMIDAALKARGGAFT